MLLLATWSETAQSPPGLSSLQEEVKEGLAWPRSCEHHFLSCAIGQHLVTSPSHMANLAVKEAGKCSILSSHIPS